MMNRPLLVSDLDNTLIHSQKHRRPGDVCVEYRKGKEQGFTSPRALDLLREVIRTGRLVPVTTRSVEQYLRILWPDGVAPEYAVTTNGALLLWRGEIHPGWLGESQREIAPYRAELDRTLALATEQNRFVRCRMVDEMYVFAYCGPELDIREAAASFAGKTALTVIPSGRKLYFLPPSVSKGTALLRLKALLKADRVMSAGDSRIDLPMLALSERALVPPGGLAEELPAGVAEVAGEGEPFAEFVLRTALGWLGGE